MPIKTLIMGAAGRDFHNFNTFFRGNKDYEVVAFTATQIPDIEGRLYPKELAGALYPKGIPIYAEEELVDLIKKHGVEQVKIWRRSYDIPPPVLTKDDERYPGKDPRYARLRPEEIPLTESLKDTVARFLPYWHETIAPVVQEGKRVIIAAHGNSLRALVKFLDNIPDSEIVGLNIPTGIPLVYELKDDLKPIRSYYLGDPEVAKKAAQAVADQLKKVRDR